MAILNSFTKVILVLCTPAIFLCVLVSLKEDVLRASGKPVFWVGKGAGEAEVFGPIKIGIDLLRKNNIHDYNLNYAGLGPYQVLWEQRTVEGAWPIRFLKSSHTTLSYQAISKPGCDVIDQSNGIMLYACR